MVIHSIQVVWLMSIIALSIGGTFVIIYILKHVMDYFERRKNRWHNIDLYFSNDKQRENGLIKMNNDSGTAIIKMVDGLNHIFTIKES